jgi:ferritin
LISPRIVEAINRQIVQEFSSAYLYLAMAAHLEGENLQGFAKWMRVQAQEEAAHALILFNYVTDRDGRPLLGGVDAPGQEFGTPQEVFKKVKDHERKVTASLHSLMDLAMEEKDYATRALLDWFITEQVEEQSVSGTIHGRLKHLNGDASGVFLLDQELGTRVFLVPAPLAGKV